MRLRRLALLGGSLALVLGAADLPRWVSGQLEDVEFKTRLVRDLDEIRSILGSDLDGEFIVTEIEVRPLYNSLIQLSREDFLLRSYANNETSLAQSPERIAGGSVLVLGKGRPTRGGGGVFSESRDPVLVGGAPGTGTRPRALGSPDNVALGSGRTSTTSLEVSQDSRPAGSLVERLAQAELPVGPTRTPVRGYLFFQVNPKHKPKNLVLTYDGPAGECKIPFKKK